ncbi:MAG: peptide chain release factor 1 [Verrucomicrobia bacterium]|nr:peptide chain release factor 1 [Verrucomicrobiota bacterium]
MIDKAQIQKIGARRSALEAELADPAIAADHKKFREKMAEHARLKRIEECAAAFMKCRREMDDSKALIEAEDTDSEMREMALAEYQELEEKLPQIEKTLMISLLPPDPSEERGVIIEIRAGTGGDEAALFAADMFRMYSRYAETQGWKVSMIDANPSNIGGYKEVICSIEGAGVYRMMKYESGVHRVQRIPETEASGRIHTSAATVAVLAEADEVDDLKLSPEDIRVDVFRSSGPGGQSVNTTDSAVRVTHVPTGIVVQCQDEKSQHRNKDKAMRVLKARILDKQRSDEAAKQADQRRSQIGSGDRSERIRTYNFPQNRVTDHRIGLTLYSLDRVMEGNIDELVSSLYNHDLEERMQRQMEV